MEPRHALNQQLGKYQLVTTLGQGGMGTVYLALASGFGEFRKLFVVKELRQDLTLQAGFVSMFMDEAKLAARLSHPNVVQTFEASEDRERYFLAMEYLDGQSLSTVLDRVAKLPTSTFTLWMHIQILCEALAGLHYAHELLDYDGTKLNVVHRDVSPQNVFVTYHGQVKVVDFGVAKAANASVKTAPGVFVGKFSYAAPEQVLGMPVDARTDVFAVGVMLWQAIAGRPFSDQAPTTSACRARTHGLEPRIAEVVPLVDPALAKICDRALAVDPDDRYSSAKEFRAELQDYLQQAGVRVEAAEIGQLMHEVFDEERRTLHARIERAMRHTGAPSSLTEELSMLQVEKVPTAVADLSSLVEVSLERDDQKIQQGYAHSKVTLLRTPSVQKRGIRMPTFVNTPRRRLQTFVALGLIVAVGIAVLLVSRDRGPERVVAKPLPPLPASAPAEPTPPVPAPPAPKAETSISAATAAPVVHDVLEPEDFEPTAHTAVTESTTPSRRRSRSNSQPTAAPRSTRTTREREPPRPPIALEIPEPPAPLVVTMPPPVVQRPIEEGADLTLIRRDNTIRIDRENPYR